jgi:hypothetical protein
MTGLPSQDRPAVSIVSGRCRTSRPLADIIGKAPLRKLTADDAANLWPRLRMSGQRGPLAILVRRSSV